MIFISFERAYAHFLFLINNKLGLISYAPFSHNTFVTYGQTDGHTPTRDIDAYSVAIARQKLQAKR